MNIVWFKRDLRLEDNESFHGGLRSGPVLPIYIVERELWLQPDLTGRQYNFLKQCLAELDQSLRNYGGKLIIKVGDAVQILAELKGGIVLTNCTLTKRHGTVGPLHVMFK